jgi:hypothetical protein
MIVVGTRGATTLPARMCDVVAARGAPLIVVDVEPTVFSQLAQSSRGGRFVQGRAVDLVPRLARQLSAAAPPSR